MDWIFLTLPVSAIALAAFGFVYIWLQSRAYDRKWGKRHPPGE